jgi:hypothetical protein
MCASTRIALTGDSGAERSGVCTSKETDPVSVRLRYLPGPAIEIDPSNPMGWALALHGGAGDIPRSLAPELRDSRLATLRRCLDVGTAALRDGRAALDVVELVVSRLILPPPFLPCVSNWVPIGYPCILFK